MDTPSLRTLLESFLKEDIGHGDITSEAIFSSTSIYVADFVAKQSFIVAGMESIAAQVFLLQNPDMEYSAKPDGTTAVKDDILLTVKGPVLDLLKAERVALNLVQRLCGIATLTAKFVEKVKPLPVRIVDTRKTTPGLRALEKYAVRIGGGYNHRFNLEDGVIIKDNHIAASGSIQKAVELVRKNIPHTIKIEVEAESLEQVRECLACNIDIIMLDNMDVAMMREAVILAKGQALLEASGCVTLENVKEIAATGVEYISVGALTHSAPACDISMRCREAKTDQEPSPFS